MNNDKLLFLTVARQHANPPAKVFVGRTEPFIAALQEKGMSHASVLAVYRALKGIGHIQSHGMPDIDVFTVTPSGLKWLLTQEYGDAKYRKLALEVKQTIMQCLKERINGLDEVAKRLQLPMLAVQEIVYAEGL